MSAFRGLKASAPSDRTRADLRILRAVRHASFADRPADLALHRPAVEGGVAGVGFGFAGVVGPLGFGVEDDHIGEAAHGERAAAFQVQQRRRLGAQQAQYAADGHLPLLVQPAQREAQRRLQAGNAVGGVLELDLLLMHGVGRVVGGERVHSLQADASRTSGCQRRLPSGSMQIQFDRSPRRFQVLRLCRFHRTSTTNAQIRGRHRIVHSALRPFSDSKQ